MSEPQIRNLGGSVYAVMWFGEEVGRVQRTPSRSDRWTAYRRNPDEYYGPLGGPWDHPTRREAIAHLLKVVVHA